MRPGAAGLLLALVVGGCVVPRHAAEPRETPMTTPASGRPANRLITEKSPYLLQHAHNPVDWHPWGAEALAKAKAEDKPIFLSIGYSTCYWCHVMEAESFEHPQIAELLNARFVPVKVDREERPDLDALYLGAVMAMTGQGGWPTTVFLTPDGRPFWGGTYFPPEDRGGLPGLPTVLGAVAEAWTGRREELLRSAQAVTQAIQAHTPSDAGQPLTAAALETAAAQFTSQFDPVHGGFGEAPKFPRSHALSLLLRQWFRTRESRLLEMVERTLEAMARGGLHDQLGGGFHRYATDAQWLVPHFEKMLYDQALISRTYLEAYQVTAKPAYAAVARDTFEYVLRTLRDPQGGFYAAEDAGEVGKEGEFYLWTPEEVAAAVGAESAAWVTRVYGVTPGGTFEGRSILHVEQTPEAIAAREGLSAADLERRLAQARTALLDARSRRQPPHRDDKVLTDWNGLMIGAFAYGARVLEEPRYAQAAEAAAGFLLSHLRRDGRLLHRYRDGEASIPAFLDDYAFLSWGLLELFETTQEPRWLDAALQLARQMVSRFRDEAAGGFFLTGAGNERLVAQTKELYDGAVPSGNSVAALLLVRLGQLTGDAALHAEAERALRAFAAQVRQAPHAFPSCLAALDAWLGPSQEIVIAGDPKDPAARRLRQEVDRRFLPRATRLVHPVGPSAAAIERLVPFVAVQQPLRGRPTAYVCQHHTCQLPTTELVQLRAQLEALR